MKKKRVKAAEKERQIAFQRALELATKKEINRIQSSSK
jgi:hypothetical protein